MASSIVSHYIDLAETTYDIRSITKRMEFLNRKPCESAHCQCDTCEEFNMLSPELILLYEHQDRINEAINEEVEDCQSVTNLA